MRAKRKKIYEAREVLLPRVLERKLYEQQKKGPLTCDQIRKIIGGKPV